MKDEQNEAENAVAALLDAIARPILESPGRSPAHEVTTSPDRSPGPHITTSPARSPNRHITKSPDARYNLAVSVDERAFFSERPESRPCKYTCPRCRRTNEYAIRFVRRMKKDRPPQGADERDRAKFAKLRDHLLRLDDEVTCKSCAKRFEIPSLHSLQFVDQLEGLPKDDEADQAPDTAAPASAPTAGATAAAAPAKPPLPARFTRPTRGWRG